MNIRSTPILTCDPVLPTDPVATRPISLGFLSEHNPYDRTAFSGTVHFAAKALRAFPGVNLRVLGPHRPPRMTARITDRVLRRSPPKPGANGLDLTGLDAIVSVVSTPLVNALADRTSLPLFHVTDATPSFLRSAYGWDIPEAADQAEARAIAKATAVVYSSTFMAEQAQRDFGTGFTPAVAPFGVNFDQTPLICPEKPGLDRLELLFICSDWDRKGGDTAVATLEALIDGGTNAHLTIAGRMPEGLKRHPHITFAGFLNKNNRRDTARLAALYTRAHLLLVPSKADCTPMVLAEAMAHGTPVLATHTRGTSEAIETARKVVGRTLPRSASPIIWAAEARAMTADPATYTAISMATFEHSLRLSWTAWSNRIVTLARTSVFGHLAYAAA